MKKNNRIHISILLSTLLLLSSCELFLYNDLGELQVVEISYDEFSQLSFFDIFDVELRSDSVYSVEIETMEKYIDLIEVENDSGNLIFTDNNSMKWLPEYTRPKLRISFPALDNHILIEAPVNMYSSDTLSLPRLYILSLGKTCDFNLLINSQDFTLATGSDNIARYNITGTSSNVRLWARGSSSMDASELVADNCSVSSNTIGECRVKVRGKLEVHMNALGNVYYYGNPSEIVILEESGEGRLLPADE